jgi:uncharacterized protein (DUF305 family)
MKLIPRTGRRLICIVAIIGFAAGSFAIRLASGQTDNSDEAAFMAGNDAAMAKMMGSMTIKPAGDVDRDFAAMMIPHHQGAIDMAKLELSYGHDPVLRRLAQAIVVEQQQEIDLMQRSLDKRSE